MDSPSKSDAAEQADESDAEQTEALPAARVSAEAGKRRKKRKPMPLGQRIKKRWRAWLRAVHRDIGYLAVGLTFVYALSGIAINHLGDWDPNFAVETENHTIRAPLSTDDEEVATKAVLLELGITKDLRESFFEDLFELTITLADDHTLVVDLGSGAAVETSRSGKKTHAIEGALPEDDAAEAASVVLDELDIASPARATTIETRQQLEIYLSENDHKVIVDVATGAATETYESSRFFLRVANWLHYNRGKSAWTYIADGYAIFLLFLALSGMFMLKGRKGIIGRGAVLVAIGAAVPIFYVHFASGP